MKGVVFRINIPNSEIFFVGSALTKNKLKILLIDKIRAFRGQSGNSTPLYKFFNEAGLHHFQIEAVRQYEVIDRSHLQVFETLWIKKLKPYNRNEPAAFLLSNTLPKNEFETLADGELRCICGSIIKKDSVNGHNKSKNHISQLSVI